MKPPTIFLSAGDYSGDIASARLVDSLRERNKDLLFTGLGGRLLKKIGQKQIVSGEKLSVIGFWEVLKNIFFFKKLLNQAANEIKSTSPNLVLLVDYPGFNLRLAEKVKSSGIPIIYYISPQVWAWGKGRIGKIRELIDKVLCILPFEQEFLSRNDIVNEFVGHYLMEDIPESLISSPLPDDETLTLGLLPGSRAQEIERMLAIMLDASELLAKKCKLKVLIAGISNRIDYQSFLNKRGKGLFEILFDDSRKVIGESNLILCASGTATLETGIIGRPMVVIYKTGIITYQIAKRVLTIDKIALVNLVLNEKVVPELIQNQATAENISNELFKFIENQNYRDETILKLHKIPSLLGGKGASQRAANIICEYL